MSNYDFLVFENTQPVMSFNSIDVFSTGSSLPWTYYTNSLRVDNEGKSGSGFSKIMMTAESKDVTIGDQKVSAGVAVTKLRTFVNGAEVVVVGDGPGGQVSAKQYLECGWPLTKDENSEYILPKYGDFTFCKEYKPSFEDSSQITMHLQIGFGLNTTIYNYQDAEVKIGIHNLSVEPTFFISSKPNIGTEGIQYDEDEKRWKRMIGSNEDTSFKKIDYNGSSGSLDDNIYEGDTEESLNNPYKYLFIKVEAGEGIRVDLHSSDKELKLAPTRNGKSAVGATLGEVVAKLDATNASDFVGINANTFYDVQNDGTNTARSLYLDTPNKSTVASYTQDVTQQDIGKELGMSFYVLKIAATADYNQFSYVGSKQLKQTISVTPVPDATNTSSLGIFKRSLDINLTLLPSKSSVFIRDDFTAAVHNFYDHAKATAATFTGTGDLSDQSNLRQRIVISPEEAINYAYNYDDASAPSFVRELKNQGKSVSEVFRHYQKSILTDVENKFYDYKASFENDSNKVLRMAIYAALDLSQSIKENFDSTFKGKNGGDGYDENNTDLSGPVDLSAIYYGLSLPALRTAIATNITANGLNPTLNEIQTRCASELGAVLNAFKVTRNKTLGFDGGSSGADQTNAFRSGYDQSNIPHTDRSLYTRQRIGQILDVSDLDYTADAGTKAYNRNSVLGHQSSLFTMLFGFHEYKNSVFDPTNPMGEWYEYSSDLSSSPAYKIQAAMQKKYKQGTRGAAVSVTAATDLSGSSDNRPNVIYDQIKEYRRKLNPTNGSSATNYLTKMLKIKDTNGDDKYYYGTDNIYAAYNVSSNKKLPTKADIKTLLYSGGLGKQIIDNSASTDTKLLNNVALVNGSFSVSNAVLNTGTGTAGGVNIDHNDINKNQIVGYAAADQSSVFYTHYRANTTGGEFNHPAGDVYAGDQSGTAQSLGYYGDLSGCTSSFYRDDLETNTMRTKWVYSKLNGMVNGFTSFAKQTKASDNTMENEFVETYNVGGSQVNWFNSINGAYKDESRHAEGTDFSGVIKFPRVIDAKYYDIYAVGPNGIEIEIKESVIDPEEMYEKAYSDGNQFTFDMSNLDYFAATDIVAGTSEYNKRVELLRPDHTDFGFAPSTSVINYRTAASATVNETLFKYDLTNVGDFQFYRIGSVVRILANGENLDADRADLQPVPTLKFRLKGASKSIDSDKMYQLHVWPSDVASVLHVTQNVIRPWAKGIAYGISPNAAATGDLLQDTGYKVSHTDASGVWVNRYNDAYIPLDVSGILEEGENITFELSNDEVAYTAVDISNVESNATNTHTYVGYFPTATTTYFPIEDGYKFKLVYDTIGSDGKYSGKWKDYKNEKFVYECHNKTAVPTSYTFDRTKPATEIGGLSTHANSGSDNKEGKDARSSNVNGKPKFAIFLPAQIGAGLALSEFDDGENAQNDTNTNRTAGRKVTLKMRAVSNKLNVSGNNVETMTPVTLNVYAYVTSSPYDPNITVQEVKYDVASTKINWLDNGKLDYTPGDITYDTEYKHNSFGVTDSSSNNMQIGFNAKTVTSLPGSRLDFTNIFFPATEEVVVGGKTMLKAKQFSSSLDRSYISKETRGDNWQTAYNVVDRDHVNKTSRDISGIDVSCNEYNHGPNMPIARINIDPNQYLKLNASEPIAEIVPMFRRHSDYIAYNTSSNKDGFLVDKDEAVAVNAIQDAANTPLYIPANKRYDVKINNGEILLYRKDVEEFTWYQRMGHSVMNTADNNRLEAVPELVNVQVKYVTPKGDVCTKTFMFFVRVTNQKGLKFIDPDTGKPTKTFNFEVNEGEREVDITKVFNAKMGQAYDDNGIYYSESDYMEGNSLVKVGNSWEISKYDDNVIYNVVGFIDPSGRAYIHPEQFTQGSTNNFDIISDLSNGIDVSNTYNWNKAEGAYVGLETQLSLQKSYTDIADEAQTTIDMMTFKYTAVNGSNSKVSLYHQNYNTNNQVSEGLISANGTPVYSTNNWFNSYTRQNHQFLVMAQYRSNKTNTIDDMSGVERALALVNIKVKAQNSGFYLQGPGDYDPEKVKFYDLNETLGTIDEGKTESENNPEIKISNFTDKIKHPNQSNKTISYKVSSLDSDLIVCPPTLPDGADQGGEQKVTSFTDLVIKLKDIPANKTTETKLKPSTKLADYSHYNFERKDLYKVGISAEISRFEELFVTKVGPTYICDLNRNANSADVINGAVSGSKSKHTTYLVNNTRADGSTQSYPFDGSDTVDVSGKAYYFKNDLGLYEGPLNLTPSKLDQLSEKTTIHQVDIPTAYVRFDNGTNVDVEKRFLPLYKAGDFRNDHVNPPVQEQNGMFEFFIRVGDTFDLAKQSPQPYTLKEGFDYKTADPAQQTLIDPMDIQAKVKEISSSQEICYVFADYEELEAFEGNDFKANSKKPNWAIDFSNIVPANSTQNDITPVKRKVHPYASQRQIGTKSTGTFSDNAAINTSTTSNQFYASSIDTYGKYPTDLSATAGVFLDMFIEYPPEYADMSGWNHVVSGDIPFGEKVDVSMNLPIGKRQVVSGANTLVYDNNTSFRSYRLKDIKRHEQHEGNYDLSGKYYSKGILATRSGFTPTIGKTYKFIVAGVTNKLATPNDQSYNANMIDSEGFFFDRKEKLPLEGAANWMDRESCYSYQKYVYDPSGAQIRTVAQAVQLLGQDLEDGTAAASGDFQFENPNAIDTALRAVTNPICDNSDLGAFIRPKTTAGTGVNGYAYTYEGTKEGERIQYVPGSLFVCRTKFKVTFAAATQSASSGSGASGTPGVNEVKIYKALSVSGNVITWGSDTPPTPNSGQGATVTFTLSSVNSGRPTTATYNPSTGNWTHN